MEHEKDGYVGEFMGADKRIKDGHWFKGTHFKLGGNQQTVMKSHSHTQFQPPQRVQTAPGTYDAKSMTRTHFLLGNEKNLGTTTANASYQAPGSDFVPSSLDKDVKAELRKSHLNLGGEPYGRYTTTNKYDYAPKIGSAACRYEQEERKVKMRKHNFNFGKEGSDYVSTHNASFQGYGKQGATNMLSKSSTDIGRTHFTLGGENAPMATVNQSEYVEKSGLSSGKTKDSKAFQQTNFKFGTDKANHMPSSHMHYRYYPHGETEKLNREQLNDLRKGHFILGKHPNQFMSVSHSAHGDLGFNMEKPIGDRLMTQSSNVQIGDPKLKSAFYQTTYEVSNQNRSLANKSAASKCVAKEGSHFQIGNASRPTGMSQHQATYIPLNHAASKPDKDFETRIRSNHFDLGMGNPLPGQYNSVSQSAHDFKGDAQAIKSKLDADRKIDLTASHFKIGEGKSRMISTMKGDYVDNGGSQSAFNDDKRRDLRNSHFMLGDPSKVDFKTTHDINYKWVQPRKAPL